MLQSSLRLFCKMFGHSRSRRLAHLDPVERRWRSYCSRCGTRMKKDAVTGWEAG
ncbi:DUF1660 family phage protein [Sphingomonas agri]|uniref:DUF1660 family phage protein n=1 Tax=Sphingomonas agri TaxID=1813878 RepID=UPI00311FCE37